MRTGGGGDAAGGGGEAACCTSDFSTLTWVSLTDFLHRLRESGVSGFNIRLFSSSQSDLLVEVVMMLEAAASWLEEVVMLPVSSRSISVLPDGARCTGHECTLHQYEYRKDKKRSDTQ